MLIATGVGAFTLGALVGGGVIYITQRHKRVIEGQARQKDLDYYGNIIGEQIEQIRQLEYHVNHIHTIDPYDDDSETRVEIAEHVEEPEEDDDEVPDEPEEVTRANLQSLIDQYTASDSTEESYKIVQVAGELDKAPPFVISREDFAYNEEYDDYEKITLTYYQNDRIVLDSEEDVLNDVATVVGWRNLSQFGGDSEDPDVVFVRNHRLQTDFEIVREEDSSLPLHVKYGMEKEEFRVNKAAGLLKLRQEDDDY